MRLSIVIVLLLLFLPFRNTLGYTYSQCWDYKSMTYNAVYYLIKECADYGTGASLFKQINNSNNSTVLPYPTKETIGNEFFLLLLGTYGGYPHSYAQIYASIITDDDFQTKIFQILNANYHDSTSEASKLYNLYTLYTSCTVGVIMLLVL